MNPSSSRRTGVDIERYIAFVLERYIAFVLKRRWLVIGLAVLALLMLASGARFVEISTETRQLFDRNDPRLIALEAFEEIFVAADAALIAIAPLEGSVFTRETLGAIEELTESAWLTPYSVRVDSLTNYSHSWASGDTLTVGPLVGDAAFLDDAALAEVEKTALGESEIVGRLISPDGRTAGLTVVVALPENREAANIEVTDFLRAAVDGARKKHPELTFHLAGDVELNRTMRDALQDEFNFLAPVAFAVTMAVAALLLRSVWGTVALLFVLVSVVNSAMGFAGWTGMRLTGANSTAPMIVMTVTVAHSVHIVGTILCGLGRGLDRNAAIADSLRSNIWPVFLTSLTTATGFLSLNFSDSPPFRILGNIVSFGVLCAFVYSVTLLPALMSVLPMRSRARRLISVEFFDCFAGFVITFRKALLWTFGILVVVLVIGTQRIEFTDNWTEQFDNSYDFRRAADFIAENLTGLESLEYSLSAGREGGITDPQYLRKVDAFAEWFRKQPEVSHVQAFPDILKRLNKNMHGDDPAFYRLPENQALAAQNLLLYEFTLPAGRDLNNRIDVGKSATRMTVVLHRLSSARQIAVDERAQAWLEENAHDLITEATGISVAFAHVTRKNIESMLRGTIAAMAVVSLLLLFVFKSRRLGLISLVPNFLPAAMTFGLWGFLIGSVGMAASIVTAIAFGIVVDDTIHFLTKYASARKEGLSPSDSVRSAFRAVGHALWTTTSIFALGFMVFTLSGLASNTTLGLLVGIMIVIALFTDFLLLPPLLLAFDHDGGRPPRSARALSRSL